MKNNKTTIFILVDALRHDYINEKDSPFLYKMSNKGLMLRKIKPVAGYGQRAALCTGAYPDKTNTFTMLTYDPNSSPYKISYFKHNVYQILDKLEFFMKRIIIDSIFKKLLSKLLRRIMNFLRAYEQSKVDKNYQNVPAANIPLCKLSKITSIEDEKLITNKKALGIESIFDVLQEYKESYKYLMYPVVNSNDNELLEITLRELEKRDTFYMLQFSDTDTFMHQLGTENLKRREVVKEVDDKINKIYTHATKYFEHINLVVAGDHGMVNVETFIDAEKIVRECCLKIDYVDNLDYFSFYDSTMIRIFCINNQRKDELLHLLNSNIMLLRNGIFLKENDYKKHRIPANRCYGDIIWWANPGVLIYPDYFHSIGDKNLAMHGYDSSLHEDSYACGLVYSSQNEYKSELVDHINLNDICPILCDLINVRYPSDNEGVSILNNHN